MCVGFIRNVDKVNLTTTAHRTISTSLLLLLSDSLSDTHYWQVWSGTGGTEAMVQVVTSNMFSLSRIVLLLYMATLAVAQNRMAPGVPPGQYQQQQQQQQHRQQPPQYQQQQQHQVSYYGTAGQPLTGVSCGYWGFVNMSVMIGVFERGIFSVSDRI